MCRKYVAIVLLLTLLAMLLFPSCAPRAEPSPSPLPMIPKATPAESAPAAQIPSPTTWEVEWGKVLEGAKKEGSVVIYISAGAELRTTLGQAFKNKYGIPVEGLSGRGSELGEKVSREQSAGLFLGDVLVGATTSVINTLKPGGNVDSLKPALILPELTEPALIKKTWWSGELLWVDREQRYMLAHAAYPSAPLAINTQLVKPEEIKSFRDLLNPKWKGKIAMNDPTVAGSGLTTFRVTADKMGGDYMRELAKQEPIIVRDQRLLNEWLAHGKYTMVIGPDTPAITTLMQAGAPLRTLTPAEGSHLTGGYATVALLRKSPHPNAAKIFTNWLLGVEAQTLWSKTLGTQSAREDVPTDFVDPEKLRRPGVSYFWTYREEWLLAQDEGIKIAKEIFGHLTK